MVLDKKNTIYLENVNFRKLKIVLVNPFTTGLEHLKRYCILKFAKIHI